MKTLIVGGNSSLGRALAPSLSEFSEVITADTANCDIRLDLNDSIKKIIFPDNLDAVIHAAASFGGNTAKEILDAESVNVLGTLKLCQEAVRAQAKHFVFISSIFSCLEEDSIFFNIYALSKKHSEEIARFYCHSRSLPLTILRPSQMYGNEESFRRHQPFFYSIIDKAEKGEDIKLYGSKDAWRNYIHVDDLVKIIVKVVQRRVEGTYSCVYPKDITYSEIAKAAFSAFHSRGNVLFLKDKEDIPDNVFEKDVSLYEKIKFYPQITIEEGMKRIANYRKIER